MIDWKSYLKGDMLGVHYAVRIFVATTVLWLVLRFGGETNPIWAISSMIAVSDPEVKQAFQTFWGRILNAILGCVTGLIFLVIGGTHEWVLPFGLAITVLVSAYVVRIQVMWRQAPITAALILTSGLVDHSRRTGMEAGLKRVAEVLLGCVVGFLVTWLISAIWPPPEPVKEETAPKP
jgi:uncharacterized membrane protein YccC